MMNMCAPQKISLHVRILTCTALMLGAASICSAGSVTYNLNLSIGSGSVTGFIETDGTLGPLFGGSQIHLLDWNLLLTDSDGSFDVLGPLSGSNSTADVEDLFGHGMFSASSTQLLYNFGGGYGGLFFSKTGGGTYLQFSDEGVPTVSGSPGESLVINNGTTQYTNYSGSQVIGTSSGSATPEPSTFAFLSLGIGFCGFRRPRREQNRG